MRNLPNFQQGRFEICFQQTKGLLVSVYSGDRNHASFVDSEKSVQRMINAAQRKEKKKTYYSTENCRKQLALIGLREEKESVGLIETRHLKKGFCRPDPQVSA